MRIGRHQVVLAPARRLQIGDRGAAAPARRGCRLITTDTLLAGAIEVPIGRDARFQARGDDGLDEFVSERLVTHIERPADPVKLVLSTLLVLRFAKVGQDTGIIPTLATALPPAVVVGRRAAHVDQAVEGTGTAKHLAARLIGGAIVEPGYRLAFEFPVVVRVVVKLVVAEGNVNPGIAIAAPGFQQQHRITTRFGKPRGDRTTCRSRARNDEIEGLRLHVASEGAADWSIAPTARQQSTGKQNW